MTVFPIFQKICCDLSLELSQRDSSNDGPQHMLNSIISKIILKLSLLLLLIWSTVMLN